MCTGYTRGWQLPAACQPQRHQQGCLPAADCSGGSGRIEGRFFRVIPERVLCRCCFCQVREPSISLSLSDRGPSSCPTLYKLSRAKRQDLWVSTLIGSVLCLQVSSACVFRPWLPSTEPQWGTADREEALRAFKLGVLSLQERAMIDRYFDTTCDEICALGESSGVPLPQPLQPETRPHSLLYHINLSGTAAEPMASSALPIFSQQI